jgi:EGF-like domain
MQLSDDCIPTAGEPGGICSGRGICVVANTSSVNATCYCEPGWSSIGDFATNPSVDCGIYVDAQRGLWGACACSNFALMLLSMLRLWQNRRKLSLKRVDARVFGGMFVESSMFTIIGILQAVNNIPGARSIGIDVTTTALFAIGTCAFFGVVGCLPRP